MSALKQISPREWSLLLPADWEDKLDHIPGLRVMANLTTGNAFGTPDAIAVAAKRLGIKETPPVSHHNDLPFDLMNQTSLFPYQVAGISQLLRMLKQDGGALLADDMGLGKTRQALEVARHLNKARTLIVCPGSVRFTWDKQVKQWLDQAPFVITKGTEASTAEAMHSKYLVTSYELAGKLHENYMPDFLIVDEAHNLRGRWAKRSKRLLELASIAQYKLALTGTPIWSRPRDLWMLLKILFKWRFGTAEEFDYAYCGATINQWGGRENKGSTRPDELKTRLNYVMVRREKKEVANQLPTLTRVVDWVEAEKPASLAFQKAMMTKQAGSTFDALQATLQGKLKRAVELACEARKFLLFTYTKEHARWLANEIEKEGVNCLCITGDLSVQKRQSLVDSARGKDLGVVATIDSVGTGVDGLQHLASTAIFHALDYTPIKLAQAEARLDRTGQTEPVTVIYIAMRESMDARVIETAVEKLDQTRQLLKTDTGIRDALNAHEDGAGAEEYEKAALRALYESF